MAIVNNFWLKGAKKRLAGAVIYQTGGQTIARSLAESVSNPQTRSQMNQRVKWANLVAFYRANAKWMKYAYETKRANQSEYNKMMSLNVTNSRIYLPKLAAASGACVVDSYIMTQGSLPSITYNRVGELIHTNLYLSEIATLDENSTIAELTRELLAGNPGLREGDQLSLIRYTQMVNQQTGYPYVVVRKYEMLLSLTNRDQWSNFWPASIVEFAAVSGTYFIAVRPTGNAGGLLMCLSRTISGKTYVSTQSILPVDNDALINAYSSQAALNAAIQSYGESEDAFLTTDNANFGENEPIELVPLSITYDGRSYVPNSYAGTLGDIAGKTLSIDFNYDFNESPSVVYIDTYSGQEPGTATQETLSVSGNKVIVPSVSAGDVDTEFQIRKIRVQTDDYLWEIEFAYNNNTGGLE